MRTIAAILLLGCLAAVPVAAQGQTSILPAAGNLNPRADNPHPDSAHPDNPHRADSPRADTLRADPSEGHGDALNARGEITGGLAAGLPRVTERSGERAMDRTRRGEARAPHGRLCFNQVEAREIIAVHRLIDPLRALRTGRQLGDALSAKLCRWEPEQFVYEVNVLRHDGRILHLFMNALNGEAVNGAAQAVQAGGRAMDRDR